ncbi:MAG: thiamine pyrophosphate-dependent enzyme [Thermoplasmata archaeon]
MKMRDLPEEDWFVSGHTACPGCGAATIAKIAMKVFGPKTITYFPANCMLVFSGTYPLNSFKVPYFHVLFETSAICAAGVSRALKRLGKDDVNVVAFAGDGGTADIGIQALSGAAERNEDIIYICYDNEAYMNTGIQRSGATPFGAWTTTTPVGDVGAGKEEYKKDIPRIMIAHDAPYVATATLGFIPDLLKKLEKAKNKKGMFRYLQIYSPCPPGWRMHSSLGAKVSKMVVETGLWTLYEFEDGKMTINKKPKMISVEDYIKLQGRFRHMTKEQMETLQKYAEEKWRKDQALAEAYS